MSRAEDYLSRPPRRRRFSCGRYRNAAKKCIATFFILLRHTLSVYGKFPPSRRDITENSPKGVIRPKLLRRIEQLSEAAKVRSEHLEQKATATLSALGITAPIVIALSAFIGKAPSITLWVRNSSLFLIMLAIASMAIAFLAVLRALSVREREELGIGSVISSSGFRKVTDDFHGRGLLYVYIKQQALNDHIADFIRASQMLLAFAVALVLLAGIVVVPGFAAASRQQSASDPALLRLNSTLETLIDRADQTEALRKELHRMQDDLGKMQSSLQSLSKSQANNAPVASPATHQSHATQPTLKRAESTKQP